jgi:hypothetical protein
LTVYDIELSFYLSRDSFAIEIQVTAIFFAILQQNVDLLSRIVAIKHNVYFGTLTKTE